MSGGPRTPVVARFLVVSVITGSTITLAASVAGLIGPPKVVRITPLTEKPSSPLIAAWLGMAAFGGWMLMVPSVEPAKYRSVGYGRTPAEGWNSAVLVEGAAGGVAPPGLPLPL